MSRSTKVMVEAIYYAEDVGWIDPRPEIISLVAHHMVRQKYVIIQETSLNLVIICCL